MSGGVDSSVCAALLLERGFEVIGMFMKLWSENENRCCNIDALEGARKVAARLKIPFYVVDLKKEFKDTVVSDFIDNYADLKTPNPCVVCNRKIKFDFLLKKALAIGADHLATGHYVRIAQESETKNVKLKTAVDSCKDQSYFLWTLTQDQLKHVLFPIGDFKKSEVRKMAKKWRLPTAERPESQGICFIKEKNTRKFLAENIKIKPGPIKDQNNQIVGRHLGLPFYTIGQRQGIKVPAQSSKTAPLYVVDTDQKTNTLYVGKEDNLYKKELRAEKISWISGEPKTDKMSARIRYGHPAIPCRISRIQKQGDKLKVIFSKAVRAITPGQSIVFYQKDQVLGGGIIER